MKKTVVILAFLLLIHSLACATEIKKLQYDYIALYYCDQQKEFIKKIDTYQNNHKISNKSKFELFKPVVIVKAFKKNPKLYQELLVLAKTSKNGLLRSIRVLPIRDGNLSLNNKIININDLKKEFLQTTETSECSPSITISED